MKRLILVVCGALALLLPSVASAQVPHGDSKKVTMYISDTFVAGTTTVTPGEYKFQCKMIDGVDYLIITSADTGKEVARVPCTPEALQTPAATNQVLSRKTDTEGVVQLTAVRFKGETIGHRLILPTT